MRHGFGADNERGIAQSMRDRKPGMAERDAARGARPLHLRAGNVWEGELLGDQSGQHLLAIQRPRDEIAEIERTNALPLDSGFRKRLRTCPGGKVDNVRAELPECG
jgi:hypothetical protein